MLKHFFRSRLFITSIGVLVLFVSACLLYLRHVERQTAENRTRFQEQRKDTAQQQQVTETAVDTAAAPVENTPQAEQDSTTPVPEEAEQEAVRIVTVPGATYITAWAVHPGLPADLHDDAAWEAYIESIAPEIKPPQNVYDIDADVFHYDIEAWEPYLQALDTEQERVKWERKRAEQKWLATPPNERPIPLWQYLLIYDKAADKIRLEKSRRIRKVSTDFHGFVREWKQRRKNR